MHSSSIIELPNGDMMACWFEGSGERNANDVQVKGARLKKGKTLANSMRASSREASRRLGRIQDRGEH